MPTKLSTFDFHSQLPWHQRLMFVFTKPTTDKNHGRTRSSESYQEDYSQGTWAECSQWRNYNESALWSRPDRRSWKNLSGIGNSTWKNCRLEIGVFELEIWVDDLWIVTKIFFLDILKIDHLWILPNLEILSLAFNKIDKIENLESLGKLKELNLTYNSIEKLENFEGLKSLEILSVFGNKITRIENVDCLDKLIIFSAGNNLINTKDGVSLCLNSNKSKAIQTFSDRTSSISQKSSLVEL